MNILELINNIGTSIVYLIKVLITPYYFIFRGAKETCIQYGDERKNYEKYPRISNHLNYIKNNANNIKFLIGIIFIILVIAYFSNFIINILQLIYSK